MKSLYKYISIVILVIALGTGLYFIGHFNGARKVETKLANERARYQEQITKVTVELQRKDQEIQKQRRINREVIANAKDPTGCLDTAVPESIIGILR